jgi:hypothetical protein
MRVHKAQTQFLQTLRSGLDVLRVVVLALPVGLTVVACDRSETSAASALEPVAAAVVDPVTAPASAKALLGASTADAPLPAASAVLGAVYGGNDKSATEYALADGRDVGFWQGYAYRNGDDERYTAFVHAVPPAANGIAPPGQQVELAQITYTLRDGVWQPGKPQTDVGRFGGAGQPPQFDADRLPLTYEVSSTRALLALPSAVAATGGAQVKAYELFSLGDRGDWHHAGTVQAGADFSASCKDGPATPDTACVRNIGRLRFDQAANGGMPIITVNFSGSVRSEDGAIRPSSAGDAKSYRYNDAAAAYGEPAQH